MLATHCGRPSGKVCDAGMDRCGQPTAIGRTATAMGTRSRLDVSEVMTGLAGSRSEFYRRRGRLAADRFATHQTEPQRSPNSNRDSKRFQLERRQPPDAHFAACPTARFPLFCLSRRQARQEALPFGQQGPVVDAATRADAAKESRDGPTSEDPPWSGRREWVCRVRRRSSAVYPSVCLPSDSTPSFISFWYSASGASFS